MMSLLQILKKTLNKLKNPNLLNLLFSYLLINQIIKTLNKIKFTMKTMKKSKLHKRSFKRKQKNLINKKKKKSKNN